MSIAQKFADHGVPLIDERVQGRPGTFQPGGILLHWTASRPSHRTPTPALGIVKNGRSGIPGPLYQFLLGRDGIWRWISEGKANHAGRGNMGVVERTRNGDGPSASAREVGLADTRPSGGNTYLIGVSLENSGSEPLSPELETAWIGGVAAICDFYGWTAGHVTHHAAYTRRKADWPAMDMARFKRLLTERLELATAIPVGPHGRVEPQFNPPRRVDTRLLSWCVVENAPQHVARYGTHGVVQLGEDGDIYAWSAHYYGAPNNEILGRKFTILGEPARVRPHGVGGYEVLTDLGYAYAYGG